MCGVCRPNPQVTRIQIVTCYTSDVRALRPRFHTGYGHQNGASANPIRASLTDWLLWGKFFRSTLNKDWIEMRRCIVQYFRVINEFLLEREKKKINKSLCEAPNVWILFKCIASSLASLWVCSSRVSVSSVLYNVTNRRAIAPRCNCHFFFFFIYCFALTDYATTYRVHRYA